MVVQRQDAMHEYMTIPWHKLIPVDGILTRDCALIEPLSVGFHAVNRAQVTDIDTVMVIVCGMIGIGAIIRASLRGATVIAIDVDDTKLQLAKQLGATYCLNSQTENVHQRLQEITEGFGPSVAIEAVGSAATYTLAVNEIGFTGRVVYIGYAKTDIAFETKLFVQKELKICGSRNALPEDFRAVLRYLQQGNCPTDKLISRIISPLQVQSALEGWAQAPGKVMRILVKLLE